MSEVITASPNEEEAIRLEEFKRVRLQRLLQVRDAERQRAKSIRCTAEEQVALAKGDLKAKVTREVTLEFRQAMQSTRQRLRSAETSVGESFAAAQQHQEVLAVVARADYEALSRSVHVAAQRHQAAVQVEAAISSESPGAVARQRAQRMINVRQEAAHALGAWSCQRADASLGACFRRNVCTSDSMRPRAWHCRGSAAVARVREWQQPCKRHVLRARIQMGTAGYARRPRASVAGLHLVPCLPDDALRHGHDQHRDRRMALGLPRRCRHAGRVATG